MAKKEEAVEAEVVGENKVCCESRSDRGGVFWGFFLIALGGIFIAESFANINLWQYFWPGVLIVLGLSLVFRSFGK